MAKVRERLAPLIRKFLKSASPPECEIDVSELARAERLTLLQELVAAFTRMITYRAPDGSGDGGYTICVYDPEHPVIVTVVYIQRGPC